MTTEPQIDPRDKFIPRLLPWLLALVMLLVYGLTLNQWVSLFNLDAVAKVSGWTWQPEVLNPVSFIVTYPLRWLPTPLIPLALNFFSAICAALTLALLARSVALLPYDRTDAQRRREFSHFSFLTIRNAWLPPVLAVLVCGLQLTFWEHATSYTGEMFGLLLFAFVVWSLLEYRLDEDEGRWFLAALVYGAGMADNWALVGFLPLFIGAIVWSRGLTFFNLRFLGRMAVFGLVGMLAYLLLPLVAVISGKVPLTFWEVLKLNLSSQFTLIKMFFVWDDFRHSVELLSLTSLVPVLLLAIRWKSSFGDRSRIGQSLASFAFHLIHAVFFVVCIWIAFDTPLGTRHLGRFGAGSIPFLTFTYLGALGIGYFSGYFLLIFGGEVKGDPAMRRTFSRPKWVNSMVITGVWTLSLLTAAGLIWKNVPRIWATNDRTFQHYAALMVENLPRTGGYVLADDQRLILVQAALARAGRTKDFVVLDTQALLWPAYHRFLHRKFPQKWPELVSATQTNALNPLGLIATLSILSKTNEFYYLHPSFGYYFEQFYLEPHGLVYKLKTLANETLLPPLPDKDQIVENETFWTRAKNETFGSIEQAVAPVDPNTPRDRIGRFQDLLHITHEPNLNAVVAGTFYSRALDFWGVQLQRAGDLTNAAAHFASAQKLNPDNVVAQINLQFNRSLRAGQKVPVDLSKATADQFGKFGSWNSVLNNNGPFDEPSFCFGEGLMLVQGGLMRQAVAPFERVRALAPEDLNARYWLAQLYIASQLPDRALDALRDVLDRPQNFSLAKTNTTQLNVLAAGAYFQKNDLARGVQLLQTEISRHPTNDELLAASAQAYIARGLFTEALGVIDHKLKFSPDDPQWLFSRGYVSIQLKDYDEAVAALTRVLALQTNNHDARFNRAIAYLNSDKLDASRADYGKLQQVFTNSPPVAYGLGEIAWRRHETNEAVRNYEIYLAYANTNTAEATNIIQRLRDLKGPPH